jgi:hypothetical protein
VQALTLSKRKAANRAMEVTQVARMMDLEQANADLRVELKQAHWKTVEAEERQRSFRSGYAKLESQCESFCNAAETLK